MQAGPAHQPRSYRLPPHASRQCAWPPRVGTCPATSSLLACLPDGLDASMRRHAAAPTPLSLPLVLIAFPWLSPSHHRGCPSPPFAVAALRASPSSRESVQKDRRDALFLLAEPRIAGSPATPSRRRPPPRIAGAPRRRLRSCRASPTSPSSSLPPL